VFPLDMKDMPIQIGRVPARTRVPVLRFTAARQKLFRQRFIQVLRAIFGSREDRWATGRELLDHNHRRRHSDSDYRPPVILATNCVLQDSAALVLQNTDPQLNPHSQI